MERNLSAYYRLPLDLPYFAQSTEPAGGAGFFRFGSATSCYGQCKSELTSKITRQDIRDVSQDVRFEGSKIYLPFDPSQIIENLRHERYAVSQFNGTGQIANNSIVRRIYYLLRENLPIPISVRRQIHKIYFSNWRELCFPAWPVDCTVDNLHEELLKLSMQAQGVQRMPFIWFWPDGAPSCLVMTHDVETSAGRDFSSRLMDLDQSYGIKASFQVVPEGRYQVPDEYVNEIRGRGFEFNIHDLSHDGSLFRQREEFLRRTTKINEYVRRYQTRGFRSGAMYRNQDWYDAFEFSYDMSVPCVGHLEPQRGGCCTVMPYFVGKILEIPLTAVQDYSLFHVLNDYSIDLWKEQFALIKQKHGLMSFIVHPDYVFESRALKVYETLLEYLRDLVTQESVWMTLPGEVDRWWRARSQMKLVQHGNDWVVHGPEKEKARLAYANLEGGRLVYEIARI
jgi:hypothetical protein